MHLSDSNGFNSNKCHGLSQMLQILFDSQRKEPTFNNSLPFPSLIFPGTKPHQFTIHTITINSTHQVNPNLRINLQSIINKNYNSKIKFIYIEREREKERERAYFLNILRGEWRENVSIFKNSDEKNPFSSRVLQGW